METTRTSGRVREGSWIGVDLDGVLAIYPHSFPEVGPPIPRMVERVKGWLAEGRDVRIFTARVAETGMTNAYGTNDETWCAIQRVKIEFWCVQHLGARLPVTATKDFKMIACYDDRCMQMVPNTGRSLRDELYALAEAIRELA